jgi:hypothetical protein
MAPQEAHGLAPRPPAELRFDASQYDVELARAEADRWWQVHP